MTAADRQLAGDRMSRSKEILELQPKERLVLAIDTSDSHEAEMLVKIARNNGAHLVKFGLEYATATSWHHCAKLAKKYSIDWIADAKLDDIPNTTEKAITNILNTQPQPIGITVHAKSGTETLRLAQQVAGNCIIFGVTELTAIPNQEIKQRYGMSRNELIQVLTADIASTGVKGIVASGLELPQIKSNTAAKDLVTLVPGIRSKAVVSNDQHNVTTPAHAIADGADLVVVGRQITQADDPFEAYAQIVKEIEHTDHAI